MTTNKSENIKKHRPPLTDGQVMIMANFTRLFFDYMMGDDRKHHGLDILNKYRDDMQKVVHEGMEKPKYLEDFLSAMRLFDRLDKKLRFKVSDKSKYHGEG